MATFVLVHGAFSGGWGYKGIARALRADGHEVYVVTLTGLGERQHLAGRLPIDLSLHIEDVLNVIRLEELQDIILVGHSYGGMVVTGVAAAMDARIRSLVYVDAFVPEDGQSLWDLADDYARKHFIETQRTHPGFVDPFPAPPGAPPRPVTAQPFDTLVEPVRLEGVDMANKRRTYVYADGGAPTIFDQFRDRFQDDPAWNYVSLKSGHVVMRDNPEGLLAVLRGEAGQ